jgi:TrmH family RNA methyltransferase
MSLSHSEIKNLRTLHTKKGRRAANRFIAEGVRLLEEALRFKQKPTQLLFAPSLLSPRGEQIVGKFSRSGVTTHQVGAVELNRICDTEQTQGLAAVFEIPRRRLSELTGPPTRSVLLCENLSDPGNVGTLIRSALAFNFDLVVLVDQCAEAYSSKVVRASVGAVFGLPVVSATLKELLIERDEHRLTLVAAAIQGNDKPETVLARIKNRSIILAVGSEADGLSPDLIQAAQEMVRIDHSDRVESLNSAIAGSILMKTCHDLRTRRKA